MAKRKKYDDDDGRVIANMNVDGMPWYVDAAKKKDASSQELDLTKEESKAVLWGTVKAGLLIASVFVVAALIFILFCIHVWFR